jgi:hypothetical protein
LIVVIELINVIKPVVDDVIVKEVAQFLQVTLECGLGDFEFTQNIFLAHMPFAVEQGFVLVQTIDL